MKYVRYIILLLGLAGLAFAQPHIYRKMASITCMPCIPAPYPIYSDLNSKHSEEK